MANKRISELPDASAIAGSEAFEVAQSGNSKKVSSSTLKTYYSGYQGKWTTADTLPGTASTKETDYWIVGPGGWSYAPTSEFWPFGSEIKALIDNPGSNRNNYSIR